MIEKYSSIKNSNPTQKRKGYSTIYATLLLLTVFIAGCKKDDFTDEISGLCPVVVSTDPDNGATNVLLNKVITVTFNTEMNPSTINNTSLIIKEGGIAIDGTVAPTANPKVFTFTPKNPNALMPFRIYNGTVTIAAKDTLKTSLAANHEWSFTTIPQVVLTSSAGGTVSGAGEFAQGSLVTVTATNNPGFGFVNWTKNGVQVSTNPSYQFTMDGNSTLMANFSTAQTFTVTLSSNGNGTTTGAGTYVSGSLVTIRAFAGSNATFINWTGTETTSANPHTFTITSNEVIVANFSNTGPILGTGVGPTLPSLGGASIYSILTESGISTTGVTLINGNIGVSPATSTAITGFGLIMDASGQYSRSPIVTGNVYASNYAAPTPTDINTAINNMRTAYTNANNLVTPAPIVGIPLTNPGNLSGLNLAPGLYKFSTGVLIDPNTTLTLTGNANDTWVFQVAQDLTVSNSAKVVLAGGAQAKNIMWVVAGQATLGTQANFNGIILSKTLISLNNGAVVTGKLFAQTAVTLIGSTVIQP